MPQWGHGARKGAAMNAVKMIQKGNQLELPLFFLDEEPKTAEVIPFEPKPAWNDDEVRLLRDGLLWHSLRVLADGRAGSEIKQETMTWVMSDEVHPFSFVVCCDEAGYDPSGVREGVKSILKRLARIKAGVNPPAFPAASTFTCESFVPLGKQDFAL